MKRWGLICTGMALFAPAVHAQSQKAIPLKQIAVKRVHVKEPSDLCMAPDGKHFYIVSDNGSLVKTDLDFNPVQTAGRELYDPEAVYCDGAYIYVVEERTRMLHLFDPVRMEVVRSLMHPYNGGRNKGYEAFTFNHTTGRFILATEKEPIWILELDNNLRVINQVEFPYRGDVSAATWHNESLWLLSDERMELLQVDPFTFAVRQKYKLPVINPEGLAFLPDGTLVVVSDDMEKAYFFSLPANGD